MGSSRFIILMSFLYPSAATAQAAFTVIGDLPGGSPISHALGVSNDGMYVTGYSRSSEGATAFLWSRDLGLRSLPFIQGGGDHIGFHVSASGNYVTGSHGGLGFIWNQKTGTLSSGSLPGGRDETGIGDVDDRGVAIGRSSFAFSPAGHSVTRAVKWTPSAGLETIPLPGPNDLDASSTAFALLDDGRIVGRSLTGTWIYSDSYNSHEMILGAPNWLNHSNNDGTRFAGNGFLAGNERAAVWNPKDGTAFLPLIDGHTISSLHGISDNGLIAVGGSFGDFGSAQVIWHSGEAPITVVDFAISLGLNLSGWSILNAASISADGSTIIGTARHASWEIGRVEGFVLTIPAPAGAGLLATLGLGAARRRRRGFQE